MAFSDYKHISQVQEEYGIYYEQDEFIILCPPLTPPSSFMNEFEFNQTTTDIFASEASRTNLIVTPILREVYKRFSQDYTFWIQKTLRFNKKLTGAPDYMISKRSPLGVTILNYPVLIAVEAKHSDFERGWGHCLWGLCLAEMVAAQKINKDEALPVYGVVTNGEYWRFGRLVGSIFTRNQTDGMLGNLPELFGILDSVFTMALTGLSPIKRIETVAPLAVPLPV